MSNKHPLTWGRLKFDLAQLIINNWEEVEDVFRNFGAPTNKALISSEKEQGEDVFYVSISSVLEGTRTLTFNSIQLCEKMARLFAAHQFLRQSISADVVTRIEKGAEDAREVEFKIHSDMIARRSVTTALMVDTNENGSSMTNEESPQQHDSSSDNIASYNEKHTSVGLKNTEEDEEPTLPPSQEQLEQRRNRNSRNCPIEVSNQNKNKTESEPQPQPQLELEIKKEPEEENEVAENVVEQKYQSQHQQKETKKNKANVVDKNVAELKKKPSGRVIARIPTPPDSPKDSPSTSVDNVEEDSSKNGETLFQPAENKVVKFLTDVDYKDPSKHLTMIFRSEYTNVPERRRGREPWLSVERQEKTITRLDWALKSTDEKKKKKKKRYDDDDEECEDVLKDLVFPISSEVAKKKNVVAEKQTDLAENNDSSQNLKSQQNAEMETLMPQNDSSTDQQIVRADDPRQPENDQVQPEKGKRNEHGEVLPEEGRNEPMEMGQVPPERGVDEPIEHEQAYPEKVRDEQVDRDDGKSEQVVVDANRNKSKINYLQLDEAAYDFLCPKEEPQYDPVTGEEIFVDRLTEQIMTPDEIEKFNREYYRQAPSSSRVLVELTLFGGTVQKLQSMYGFEDADLCMEKEKMKVSDLYEINARISFLQLNGNYNQPWLEMFKVDPCAHFPESAHHITKDMTTKSLEEIYTSLYPELFEDKVDMKYVDQTIKFIMDRQTYISFLRFPNCQDQKAIEFEIGAEQNNKFVYPGGGKVELERNTQPYPKNLKRQNWKRFKVGQMVWVKFIKTWWPAFIIGFGQNYGFDEQPNQRQPKMGPKLMSHEELLVHVRYLTGDRSYARYEAVEHFCTNFAIRFDPSQNTANYVSSVVFNIFQLQKRGYFEEYITPKIAAELVTKLWDFKYLPPYQHKRLFSPASVQGLPDPLVLVELRQRFAKSEDKNRSIMIYQPFAFNEKSFKKTETGKRETTAAKNIDLHFFHKYLLRRKNTLSDSPIIYNPTGYIAKIFKQFKVWQDDEEEPSPKKPKTQ